MGRCNFECSDWGSMALIPVFDWEIATANAVKQLPTDGFVRDLMVFWSYPPKIFWLLIILGLLIVAIKNWPKLNLIFMLAIGSAGVGDLVSRRIFKVTFQRPRPESLLSGCDYPSCWGFISSHATNIAAVATVLCLYDKRNMFWCVPLWLLVSGSRIYLNDHFPLDVIFGGVVGVSTGIAIWHLGGIIQRAVDRKKQGVNNDRFY